MSKIIVDLIQASGGTPWKIPMTGIRGQMLVLDEGNVMKFADVANPVVSYDSNPLRTSNLPVNTIWGNKTTGEIFICTDATTNANRWIGNYGNAVGLPQGQALFTIPGTQPFVVPDNVSFIHSALVGAGAGGHYSWSSYAGAGGALAFANRIPVTPGETLLVTVGQGGAVGGNGGVTSISRGGVTLFGAQGGIYGATSATNRAKPLSGIITPNGGGQGGLCSSSGYGGGGGAGGYGVSPDGSDACGGDGLYGSPSTGISASGPNNGNGTNGSGGGGAGYQSSTYGFGGGGGVGLYGRGANGNRGDVPGNGFYSTGGGSGGSNGETGAGPNGSAQTLNARSMSDGEGGRFGGGGGGSGTSCSGVNGVKVGGNGGARIIWGYGRAFPATNTADVAAVL